jgi:predicted GTPase
MSKNRTPSNPPPSGGTGPGAGTDQPNFRNNPEVDAKIDAYIKENPKYWAYVQAMPRERLERTVVLNEVRQLDRQQRMREGVMKRITRNPELRKAYDILVKDIPEDQREGVIAQIARQTRRAVARTQGQEQQTQGHAVGV